MLTLHQFRNYGSLIFVILNKIKLNQYHLNFSDLYIEYLVTYYKYYS